MVTPKQDIQTSNGAMTVADQRALARNNPEQYNRLVQEGMRPGVSTLAVKIDTGDKPKGEPTPAPKNMGHSSNQGGLFNVMQAFSESIEEGIHHFKNQPDGPEPTPGPSPDLQRRIDMKAWQARLDDMQMPKLEAPKPSIEHKPEQLALAAPQPQITHSSQVAKHAEHLKPAGFA